MPWWGTDTMPLLVDRIQVPPRNIGYMPGFSRWQCPWSVQRDHPHGLPARPGIDAHKAGISHSIPTPGVAPVGVLQANSRRRLAELENFAWRRLIPIIPGLHPNVLEIPGLTWKDFTLPFPIRCERSHIRVRWNLKTPSASKSIYSPGCGSIGGVRFGVLPVFARRRGNTMWIVVPGNSCSSCPVDSAQTVP